jgi:hypothetical protein
MTTNTNQKQAAVTITGSGKICAVIDGESYVATTDHPKYKQIIDLVKQKDWNGFIDIFNISKQVEEYADGIKVSDGALIVNGQVVHNSLTERIIKFMSEGLPFEPMLRFLGNLMENPSKRAVDELYTFLEVGELPITEDGCFLAFKNVRSDYTDIHSGKFDNKVGSICQMPRNQVCDDKDRTCSEGLHFCSINYLPHFTDASGGKTMILKINPADVVSIPSDYKNTKGRCCRYEVVSEYKDDWRSKISQGSNGFDSNLYSSDGGDWEDDCEDDEEETCCNCDCGLCHPSEEDEYPDTVKEHYGTKPSGGSFHNKRDSSGKFSK